MTDEIHSLLDDERIADMRHRLAGNLTMGNADVAALLDDRAALLARTEDAEKALAKIGVLAADGLTPHGWRKEALARIAALAGSSPAAEAETEQA